MQKNDLIEGSITKNLLILAWPIVLSNLMQTAYNIVDTIWVGKLGADAVAAVSLGFPIIFLLMSIAMGFTIAGTSLVSQYKGAQNQNAINKLTGQTLLLVTLASILFSIIGFLFNEQILILLGAQTKVLRIATKFLNVIFIGLTPMFIHFVFTSILRGLGDSKTPMKLLAISTLINIILDPFLIFGWGPFPQLGTVGAAIATTFSRAIVAIFGIKILVSGKYDVELRWSDLKPNIYYLKKIIVIGFPASVEQSTRAIGMALMTSTVAAFGTMAVAAYGIGNRILSLVYMPALGISAATTTLVGQNLGAGNKDQAEKTVLISVAVDFVILMVIGIIIFSFSKEVITIFNDNQEVLKLGDNYLRIIAFSFGFMGTLRVVNGGFRGAGDTFPAMFFSILTLCILQVPIANILAHYFGLGTSGIWWGVFIANIIGAILSFAWFKRGTWKEKVNLELAESSG